MNRKEWNQRHRVRRTMLGTKWRFLDASESLGLRVCEYDTQRQAQAARAREFREHQKLEAAVGNHADRNDRQRQIEALRSGYQTNLHCERTALESHDREGRDSCLQTAMFHRAQARAKLIRLRSLEEQEGKAK